MKIIYYSAHPQLKLGLQTGPGTHMREMIRALQNAGHEVLPVILGDILHPENKTDTAQKNRRKINDFIKILLPGILWRTLKELKLLKLDTFAEGILNDRIQSFHPNLIYERGSYMQLSGIRISKKYGIRHFIEINAPFLRETDYFEQAPTWLRKKAIRSEKQQIKNADKVFVVSSFLKEYYSRYTSNVDKIIVTPNCIDPDKIKVDEELKQTLKNKYNPDDKIIVGFVGSIFGYHGVDLFIGAMASLMKTNSNLIVFIVGDGHLIPKLKQLSESLQVQNQVIFTGSVPHQQVFTYIDLMDITVLPKTNDYCSPVKIFEYAAMGKAVIAANKSGVRDVLTDRIDGLLAEPTENSLRLSIQSLIADKAFRISLAEHFKKKVLGNYTWSETAKKIMKEWD